MTLNDKLQILLGKLIINVFNKERLFGNIFLNDEEKYEIFKTSNSDIF